jgi:exonuclease VII large subunit
VADMAGHLRLNDPALKLKQGYSIIKNSKGRVIKTVQQVGVGDIITVRIFDGSLDSKVEKKY